MPRKPSVLFESRFRTIEEANRLVEKNIGLAWKFFVDNKKKVRHFRIDPDALESIAMMGLLAASRKWNPERSKFSTFAYLCMNTELRAWFKHRRNKAERVQRSRIPDKWYNRPEDHREKPVAGPVDAADQLAVAMSALSDRERYVIEQRIIYGDKLHQIAELFGLTREMIRKIEIDAKRKAKAKLEAAA